MSNYQISRSLRFRSSASAYLNRTFSANGQTNTMSFWVKRSQLGIAQTIFGYSNNTDTSYAVYFNSSDAFAVSNVQGAIGTGDRTTTQVFRDPSAWYHIVVVNDTTNITANDRIRVYVNGSRVISFSTSGNPSLNAVLPLGTSHPFAINARGQQIDILSDCYLSEFNFIDGQALTSSSFGQTDSVTGQWTAKQYTGTYGSSGFYLPFSDNSALTTSSNVGLGKDFSGNANYWTTNNISLTTGIIVQSFTTVGSTTWTPPVGITSINYLVVGGGGGGGWGGGGGGGFRTGTMSVTPGTPVAITVGAGAASGGINGGNSVLGSVTSIGGGAGPVNVGDGSSGGSGGGGGTQNGLGGAGTPGQGFAGGRGFTDGINFTSGGGGGGAGGVGLNASNPGPGGNGGPGLTSSITGTAVVYAGGGGGRGDTYAGGSAGSGGGPGNYGGGGTLSAGGQGIVVISYSSGTSSTYDSMLDTPLAYQAPAALYTGTYLSSVQQRNHSTQPVPTFSSTLSAVPMTADFTYTPHSGSHPLIVQFNDASTEGTLISAGFTFSTSLLVATFTDISTNSPTSWLWDFGDGNTSTLQNPSHTYAISATYTVSLTASKSGSTSNTTQPVAVSSSFPFTATISSNTQNYNLKSAAIAAGWNQSVPLSAIITVGNGVIVSSASTGAYAFDTGATFPVGTSLSLSIGSGAYIVGAGGTGGTGGNGNDVFGYPGTAGGPALRAQYAVTVTNNGTVGGGGGGGGGGAAVYPPDSTTNGGGGGGGGASYGTGGASGGVGFNIPGAPGNNATLTTGGAGGAGAIGTAPPGGDGGAGGALGASGNGGQPTFGLTGNAAGGAGGAAGAAVVGKSFVNAGSGIAGTVYGVQS